MRNAVAALVLITGIAIPAMSFACGALTTTVDAESEVTLDAQRAVFHVKGERLEISLQIAGSEPSSEFAWVLPIPPDDTATVDVAEQALFDQLDEATRPRVEVVSASSGGGGDSDDGGGCGASKGEGVVDGSIGSPNEERGVDVFAAGTAGDYEYTIVGGDAAMTVLDYLRDEGFAVSDELDELLTGYLDAGMRFVAVKLADATAGEPFTAQPLVIDIAKPAELMYPLALSKASAPEETELLIYVIGDQTHVVDRATMLTSEDVANELAASGGDYRSATKLLTFDAPDSRFVIDAAGPLTTTQCAACGLDGDRHITRIYAVLAESDLRDLVIFPGGEANTVEREHTIYAALRRDLFGYAIVGLLLFGMRIRWRR